MGEHRREAVRDDPQVSLPWHDAEVLATGTTGDGFSWRLLVSGEAEDLVTLLDVTAANGAQVGGGGMAGPALPPNAHVNVSVHRTGSGPTYLVGRSDPDVHELRLTLVDGEECVLLAVAQSATLRFFAAILPSPVSAMTAFGLDSRTITQESLPPLPT